MIPLRLILGVLEAGFFPGCVYLISTWYTRYELQKRYSIFYLIGCLASACSGILAYGLMQMDGLADYSGWRWVSDRLQVKAVLFKHESYALFLSAL